MAWVPVAPERIPPKPRLTPGYGGDIGWSILTPTDFAAPLTTALIGRDPEAKVRTRQFIDRVGSLLNSLIRAGTLFQAPSQEWGVAGLLFTGTSEPSSSLGHAGDYYLRVTTGVLYKKSASTGNWDVLLTFTLG